MDPELSLDLDQVNEADDEEDEEEEEEEEADREREVSLMAEMPLPTQILASVASYQLNGLLSKAFDDLSSVTEDEEEANGLESEESDQRGHFLEKTQENYAFQKRFSFSKNGLTSTPITRVREELTGNRSDTAFRRNNRTIEEMNEESEPEESSPRESGRKSERKQLSRPFLPNHVNSPELGREAISDSLGSKLSNNNNNLEDSESSNLSYKHVQLLLDGNEKLTLETRRLRQQISISAGDYEGLSHKYKQLEAEALQKEDELIHLKGKLSAFEVQLRSEGEAKQEFARKLSIAESTIESLHHQVKEMSKSDCMVRAQENHEAIVSKLRNEFDTNILVLKGEVEGLKYENETKRQQIIALKTELENKRKEIEHIQTQKTRTISELTDRLENVFTNECKPECKRLRNELEEKCRKLEKKVKSNTKTASSSGQNGDGVHEVRDKQPTEESNQNSTISGLKVELEKSLHNLQSRRQQMIALQSQLQVARNETNDLKEKLKSFETERHLLVPKSQQEAKISSLSKQINELKASLSNAEETAQVVDDYEFKCTEMRVEVSQLKETIDSLKSSYSRVSEEKADLEQAVESLREDLRRKSKSSEHFDNERLKRMVSETTELWKKEVEAKFTAQLEAEINKARSHLEMNRSGQIIEAKHGWNRELNQQVSEIMRWLTAVAKSEIKETPSSDIERLLLPLQQLWACLENSYQEKETRLLQRSGELRAAKQELEEALVESKLCPNDCSKEEILQEMRSELDSVKDKANALKDKLTKYKRHYHLMGRKYEAQVEEMKKQFSRLIQQKESQRSHKVTENELIRKLEADSARVLEQLNQGYVDSLKQIKEHVDNFLAQSNKKSLEKIARTLLSYHELVARKITEREVVLKQHLEDRESPTSCDELTSFLEQMQPQAPSAFLNLVGAGKY